MKWPQHGGHKSLSLTNFAIILCFGSSAVILIWIQSEKLTLSKKGILYGKNTTAAGS